MSNSEIPTKPYLMRALYEWCLDNGYTPHLAVKVDARTQVPLEYVKNGEITLNVGPTAVHKMQIGNDLVEFSARFGGIARQISVPVANVFAIYGRETGHGMTFDLDAAKLTVQAVADAAAATPLTPATDLPPPEPPRPAGGRPALRRVK
ncbi:MAG: ClpXP protease specificity-enhancing factor [Burkholderiales bacterium]